MKDINIYCLSLSDSDYNDIVKKNYIPVGLGGENFSKGWISDKGKKNISFKNPYYGEYTFHYNIWKNNLIHNNAKSWIGFCTYRRFWTQNLKNENNFCFEKDILKTIPDQWKEHDSVLVKPIYTNKTKLSKIIKHGKKVLLKNPLLFFDKSKITIKVHFDMYHGHGNLDKSIDQMDNKDKEDFRKYVDTQVVFSPYNMFICKDKSILFNYYSAVFPWLEKCEKIFGFDLGNSYGKKRIYGFLAERFLSYWFNKYTNPINWPVHFKDTV
ncbi:DUF4422 domain-containing protein [bacterium]|nr:DUF4422 domain-containing protein [bacterium]